MVELAAKPCRCQGMMMIVRTTLECFEFFSSFQLKKWNNFLGVLKFISNLSIKK
jgi:hypothetical protein